MEMILLTDWGLFIGSFHPLIVHLPIGLLLLAAALEWLPADRYSVAKRLAWWSGGLSALPAVICGLLLADEGGYAMNTLGWHRWLGIGTMVLGLGGAFFNRHYPERAKWYALATAVLLMITGHLGGALTHGPNYLWQHAPALLQRIAGVQAAGEDGKPDYSALDPDSVNLYQSFVAPSLKKKCVQCHNADQQNGKLRLDSAAYLLEGGENGEIIIAGKALESEIIHRVTLPRNHRKVMPPKGEPLSYAEIRLLTWWINQGADPGARVGEMVIPGDVQALLLRDYQLDTRERPYVERLQLPPVDSATIGKLKGKGWKTNRLAQVSNGLDVALTSAWSADGVAALEAVAGHVVWLDLSGLDLADQDLAFLSRLPNLVRLRLQNTPVTDAALAHLNGLKQLESLNLYGTAITDEGLKMIADFPALKTVFLWQTQTTRAGIEALQSKRPDLEVDTGFRFAEEPRG